MLRTSGKDFTSNKKEGLFFLLFSIFLLLKLSNKQSHKAINKYVVMSLMVTFNILRRVEGNDRGKKKKKGF